MTPTGELETSEQTNRRFLAGICTGALGLFCLSSFLYALSHHALKNIDPLQFLLIFLGYKILKGSRAAAKWAVGIQGLAAGVGLLFLIYPPKVPGESITVAQWQYSADSPLWILMIMGVILLWLAFNTVACLLFLRATRPPVPQV